MHHLKRSFRLSSNSYSKPRKISFSQPLCIRRKPTIWVGFFVLCMAWGSLDSNPAFRLLANGNQVCKCDKSHLGACTQGACRNSLPTAMHPRSPAKKFDKFRLVEFFYPLRKQWYIITRQRVSHHRRCISLAVGCILFRNDDIQRQAVGDMQFLWN